MTNFSSIFYRYSLIKQIPLFSKLNLFELQKITQKSTIVEYKKGDIICKMGTPSDGFYCLISGRLRAYTMNSHGQKNGVEFIRRGMPFGITSLLTGENHSMNYEVINDSLVLRIDKEYFQTILKSIPEIGIELSQSLSKRIRNKIIPSKFTAESKIISIYSALKNTGSSTYSVNLAFTLEKETQKKVILVNINSVLERNEGASSDHLEATPQWKIQAINLKNIIANYEKISASIVVGQFNIDLLNVSFDPNETYLIQQISQFISSLVDDYHFVIVDLPNEMDGVVLQALTQSDLIHIISLSDPDNLKLTRQIIYQIEENLKENFDLEKIKVIISGKPTHSNLSYDEISDIMDFPVATKLPNIDRSDLNVAMTSDVMAVLRPNPDSAYAGVVANIARQISGVSVGLILGGGAALGVAHTGVIRVLEQENIPIDIVVGSSMGALLASFWVTGRNADGLEQLAREFESGKSMLKLFDPVVPISGLIGGRLIKRWLATRGLGDKTFYDTRIPLRIVTYDLVKRQEVVISSGSIVDAVRKSVAIPGVIEPVIEQEREFIDGGVLNPLPTNVVMNLGIKKIIAVNVLQSPEHVTKGYVAEQERLKKESHIPFSKKPWHYVSFRCGLGFKKVFTPNISDIIVRSLQASEYLLAMQSAQYADVVIHPDLSGVKWFELYKVDELVKAGEEATRKVLPEIKQLIKE